MPYPRAHYYIAGLVLLSFWGFWPGYLSQPAAVLWQHHAHGTTAGLWLLLLIAQSWAIHSGRRDLHRTAGKAAFVLAPLFLAGLLLVIGVKASLGEWREFLGAPLLAYDLIAILIFAYFIYAAFANRRNVQLHARYLLATPFLLIGPIAGRVLSQLAPALAADPAVDPVGAVMPLHISTVAGIALALFLYARGRKYGAPFLIIALGMSAQIFGYVVIGSTDWWSRINGVFSGLSMATLALAGLLLGAIAVVTGWRAPARVPKPLAG